MNKIIPPLLALAIVGVSYADNQASQLAQNPDATAATAQLKNDSLTLTGTYRWTFYLGPIEQVSTHIFADSVIGYQMRGKVHSTDYRMAQVAYDDSDKKWIGKTPEGLFYVLFFKDITPNTVTIYKHKCKKGLSEAVAFKRPPADATADHGWNVYTRQGVPEGGDALPFASIFHTPDLKSSFELHDDHAVWKNQRYQKVTHHSGERRWVGENNGRYLVIFYEYEKRQPQGKFAIQVVDDVEKAYKLKHEQQDFTIYARK